MDDDPGLMLDAELMVQCELLLALVQCHPSPDAVHLAFLKRMKSLVDECPPEKSPEYKVELRARMAQMSTLLSRLTLPTATG